MSSAPSLLPKKFPAPIAKPMWPFYTAGVVMAYAIASFANVLAATDEYKNDPRNPRAKTQKPIDKHGQGEGDAGR